MYRTIKTLIWTSVIGLLVHVFLWQPARVPSSSMLPTLLPGDYLFVSKYSYGFSRHTLPFGMPLIPGRIFFSPPERGDVVAFKRPFDSDNVYFERVIGFPGEIVQFREGVLYINDRPVGREPVARSIDDVGSAQYVESLPNGRSHTITMRAGGASADTPVYLIRDGQYLLMGDNRVEADMRQFSFVPAETLLGRAAIIFLSIRHDTGSVRTDRLFTNVD